MGIAIDILVVLFLFWSLVRGWRHGFLYQIAHLALLIVAYFASRGFASVLEKPVAKMLGSSPLVAGTLTFFALFFLLSMFGAVFVRRMTLDLIPETSSLSQVNRFVGAVTSLVKGALIAYLLIVLLIQLQRIAGKTPFPWQSSQAARLVAKHNFLDRGPLGALVKLAWIVGTRNFADLSGATHRLQKLVAHPKAKVLQSPEVLAAVGNQDYVALLQNDLLWDYLDEPSVQETLDRFDWVEEEKTSPKVPTVPVR